MMDILAQQNLFAHEEFRPAQGKFVASVSASIKQRKHVLVHAPTGLGKTAATLGPAVAYAIENKKTVFFLTARNTQQIIALETLQKLQNKHDKRFGVISLYGKQHMCLQQGINNMTSSEFTSYCKSQREKRLCSYYTNARKTSGTLDVRGEACAGQLKNNIIPLELLKSSASDFEVCPYEVALELSKGAKVVLADYYYIFNDTIRNSFFKRAEIDLADCIVIVDEAHNLPSRMKELASAQLTSRMFTLAIREADKANEEGALSILTEMRILFDRALDQEFDEKVVNKTWFNDIIAEVGQLQPMLEVLTGAGARVRDEKRSSYILGVAEFISRWQGQDNGFTRILAKKSTSQGTIIQLSYSCLDPSIVIKPILQELHSAVFMSGTLQPLAMYRDLLGLDDETPTLELQSPFPQENVLELVVPSVTTKYTARNDEQFVSICNKVITAIEAVPGNVIVFLPSYELHAIIGAMIQQKVKRTVFTEQKGMLSFQRQQLLEDFAKYARNGGAVLLAVSSGSFGEGVDLPGDLLKGVIVVGVPLAKPDLEVKEQIAYYQQKFGRGWDYAYLIPAFNVVIQNAGRCIRSATDRGVIVYMDERYAGQLKNYFPKDKKIVLADDYEKKIKEFFI